MKISPTNILSKSHPTSQSRLPFSCFQVAAMGADPMLPGRELMPAQRAVFQVGTLVWTA